MSPAVQRQVYLHVGAPKTGTTYLQNRLTLNATELARHGVHVPTGSRLVTPETFHFRAALDLLGQDWGGPRGHARGAWSKLVRRIERIDGTAVVSHEVLAAARPEVVARAMRDLSGAEVHVVYSARDLGRQLPAAWQESVKQGHQWSLRRFLRRTARGRTFPGRAFDLPSVLSTWGEHLPADRVHLVTVPHSRAESLWLRYCTAFGLDPAWAPRDSERANPSLGVPEVELLRRLNARMGWTGRRKAHYDRVVLQLLARDTLARRPSQRITLPPRWYGWAEQQAERWIDFAEASGVRVVGDLADLRPRRPEDGDRYRDPARVRPHALLDVAMESLEVMTREAARRPDPDATLPARVGKGLDRLRGR